MQPFFPVLYIDVREMPRTFFQVLRIDDRGRRPSFPALWSDVQVTQTVSYRDPCTDDPATPFLAYRAPRIDVRVRTVPFSLTRRIDDPGRRSFVYRDRWTGAREKTPSSRAQQTDDQVTPMPAYRVPRTDGLTTTSDVSLALRTGGRVRRTLVFRGRRTDGRARLSAFRGRRIGVRAKRTPSYRVRRTGVRATPWTSSQAQCTGGRGRKPSSPEVRTDPHRLGNPVSCQGRQTGGLTTRIFYPVRQIDGPVTPRACHPCLHCHLKNKVRKCTFFIRYESLSQFSKTFVVF